MLGGCATQACAVKDDEGKRLGFPAKRTPLQWAEANKAPEEVLSLLRADTRGALRIVNTGAR